MSRATLRITVACCVLAACGSDADPDGGPAADGPAADSIASDSAFSPADDRVNLPTGSIYYTLTGFDWYARGQPLVHEGRPYESSGMPINASLTEMEKAGEYQGVEYYSRAGEPATLYVPVYEGYWQSFATDPTAEPVDDDADVPDPAAMDTTGLG